VKKRKTYQPGEDRPKGKQLDGRYRGKVKLGKDEKGEPIYKYVSGSTKARLEAKKAEAKRRYVDGVSGNENEMLLGVLAIEWYEQKKGKISEATLANHKTMLNKHILPRFGEYRIRAIGAAQVQEWLDGFAGTSQSMVDKLYTMIKTLFRYAVVRGVTARDVTMALQKPEPAKKEPRRALTDEETAAVLTTIDEHPEGLFLAVLYYFGLRPSEARGVQWDDFDWEAGLLHVQRGIVYVSGATIETDLKTKAANRYISIPEELGKLAHDRRGEGWVFHGKDGGPLCQNTAKRMWMRLMVDAGLVEERPKPLGRGKELWQRYTQTITPYYLRHNYITMLYDAGVDAVTAMRIVGHADYQTTINIYTHIKNERLKQAGGRLEKVFAEKIVARKLPIQKNFIVRVK
jgi:integrase